MTMWHHIGILGKFLSPSNGILIFKQSAYAIHINFRSHTFSTEIHVVAWRPANLKSCASLAYTSFQSFKLNNLITFPLIYHPNTTPKIGESLRKEYWVRVFDKLCLDSIEKNYCLQKKKKKKKKKIFFKKNK